MAEAVIAVDPRHRLLFANAGANRALRARPHVGRPAGAGADPQPAGPGRRRGDAPPGRPPGLSRRAGPAQPRRVIAEPGTGAPPGRPGHAPARRPLAGRRPGLPRRDRPAPAGADAAGLRRQRLARAQDAAGLDQGVYRDPARLGAPRRHGQRPVPGADRRAGRAAQPVDPRPPEPGPARVRPGGLRPQPLDVVPVLAACVEAHRGRAAAKNLDTRLRGRWTRTRPPRRGRRGGRPPDRRQPDRQRHQVHARERLGPCRAARPDGDAVALEVADTGIGIPRDDLPRIFERFYRVDKARSRELGGTGLGLSIVKHLVQSIGGRIDVSSRVGSGSRFTVQVRPATRPADSDPAGRRPRRSSRAAPRC